MTITISLPIPDRAISPNARRGESRWAAIAKSRMVKAHRNRARLAMLEALRGDNPGVPQGYSLAHFWETAAYRDDDNADGACKAYRDGIADALGMDDRKFRKLALSTHAKDKDDPRVEITIYF